MSTLAVHSAFYKEHLGRENLERKFKSNQVFTPIRFDRCTISEENFKRYFNATPKVQKTPWGRSLSYGGLGPVNLPGGHRPKGEPPQRVAKGHFHYGAGVMPHPSEMKVQQFYTLTPLSKSRVRTNDQLIPGPNKENIADSKTDAKFPAEHPYASHSSRFALFPQFDTPTEMYKGEPNHLYQPTLPPETPAAAPSADIIGKSRGSPARHERVSISSSSAKSPLRWLDGPTFFQLPKGPKEERQTYYPCPPSTVRPASGAVLQNTAVSLKTAGTLNSVQKSMWVSTYGNDYTGRATPRDPSASLDENSNIMPYSKSLSSTPMTYDKPVTSTTSPATSRPPSTALLESDLTDKAFQESFESKKIDEPTTPKSVQFNRSVTFSDGMSIREIPLTSGTDDLHSRDFLKTPFPTSTRSNTANSDPLNGLTRTEVFSTERLTNSAPISQSVNHMPSQMKERQATGDPACPLKYYRPHTVGTYRSTTELLKVRDNWSKSAAGRRFHQEYPEPTPDLRRKPDLRFTDNERRHYVPEAKAHTYVFRNADHS